MQADKERVFIPEFQQRVIYEKNELDSKIRSLKQEISTSTNGSERIQLKEQTIHMKCYSKVLGERISAF